MYVLYCIINVFRSAYPYVLNTKATGLYETSVYHITWSLTLETVTFTATDVKSHTFLLYAPPFPAMQHNFPNPHNTAQCLREHKQHFLQAAQENSNCAIHHCINLLKSIGYVMHQQV